MAALRTLPVVIVDFTCSDSKIRAGQKKAEIIALEEALGSLYLWGENFGNGKLDLVLRKSEDLNEIILEFLLEDSKHSINW
jgi:hypothetical protein